MLLFTKGAGGGEHNIRFCRGNTQYVTYNQDLEINSSKNIITSATYNIRLKSIKIWVTLLKKFKKSNLTHKYFDKNVKRMIFFLFIKFGPLLSGWISEILINCMCSRKSSGSHWLYMILCRTYSLVGSDILFRLAYRFSVDSTNGLAPASVTSG